MTDLDNLTFEEKLEHLANFREARTTHVSRVTGITGRILDWLIDFYAHLPDGAVHPSAREAVFQDLGKFKNLMEELRESITQLGADFLVEDKYIDSVISELINDIKLINDINEIVGGADGS